MPASRPERPKQLLPLGSVRPLITDTVERASALADLFREPICLKLNCPDLGSWDSPTRILTYS